MALNGIEPVIIFKLYAKHLYWKEGEPNSKGTGKEILLSDWQAMPEWQRDFYHAPLPIPLYLGGLLGGEQTTGIALDDADQSIDFGQHPIGGLYFQRNIANTVTMTFRARRDNPIMIALLAVVTQLIGLIENQHYSITLYYDSAFILNGAIKSISQQTINNTNIKLVQMIIAERAEGSSDTGKGETPKYDGDALLPDIKG